MNHQLTDDQRWLFQTLTDVLSRAEERGMENYDLCEILLLVAFDINQHMAPNRITGVALALRSLVECLLSDASGDDSNVAETLPGIGSIPPDVIH